MRCARKVFGEKITEYMERFDSAYDAVKATCIQNIPTENESREHANKGKVIRKEHLAADPLNTVEKKA